LIDRPLSIIIVDADLFFVCYQKSTADESSLPEYFVLAHEDRTFVHFLSLFVYFCLSQGLVDK
jgi:hypothetical protein